MQAKGSAVGRAYVAFFLRIYWYVICQESAIGGFKVSRALTNVELTPARRWRYVPY
jgi:hypothetical protein